MSKNLQAKRARFARQAAYRRYWLREVTQRLTQHLGGEQWFKLSWERRGKHLGMRCDTVPLHKVRKP